MSILEKTLSNSNLGNWLHGGFSDSKPSRWDVCVHVSSGSHFACLEKFNELWDIVFWFCGAHPYTLFHGHALEHIFGSYIQGNTKVLKFHIKKCLFLVWISIWNYVMLWLFIENAFFYKYRQNKQYSLWRTKNYFTVKNNIFFTRL